MIAINDWFAAQPEKDGTQKRAGLEMTSDTYIVLDHGRMGPEPRQAVMTFAELGMNDMEIARYFGVRRGLVRRLREDAIRLVNGASIAR